MTTPQQDSRQFTHYVGDSCPGGHQDSLQDDVKRAHIDLLAWTPDLGFGSLHARVRVFQSAIEAHERRKVDQLLEAARGVNETVSRLSERDAREPGHPHASMVNVWANVNDPLIALRCAIAAFDVEKDA